MIYRDFVHLTSQCGRAGYLRVSCYRAAYLDHAVPAGWTPMGTHRRADRRRNQNHFRGAFPHLASISCKDLGMIGSSTTCLTIDLSLDLFVYGPYVVSGDVNYKDWH